MTLSIPQKAGKFLNWATISLTSRNMFRAVSERRFLYLPYTSFTGIKELAEDLMDPWICRWFHTETLIGKYIYIYISSLWIGKLCKWKLNGAALMDEVVFMNQMKLLHRPSAYPRCKEIRNANLSVFILYITCLCSGESWTQSRPFVCCYNLSLLFAFIRITTMEAVSLWHKTLVFQKPTVTQCLHSSFFSKMKCNLCDIQLSQEM
jgi:hypothetical protein